MKAFNKNREMTKLKFKQNRSTYIKRLSVSMSCLFLIVFVMLFTFAKYESGSPEYVLIQGTVKAVGRDVNISSIYEGNQLVDDFPTKGSGWSFDRAECTNGANASWNYKDWGLFVRNVTTKTTCSVYFENKDYIVDQILNIVSGADESSTETIDKGTGADSCTKTFAYDGTADNNLRYIGKTPCNYVSYNGELWRIIGVMNNIVTDENDDSVKESLIKLRRNDSLGTYSWDSSSGVNYNYGINQWGESKYLDGTDYEGSDIMRELNTDYLGNVTVGTDGKWYSANNNSKAAMPSATISSSAQQMIQSVVWNTGVINNDNVTPLANGAARITLAYMYEHERLDTYGNTCTNASYCNDTVIRKTTWYGKVGLFYPSDYVFATAGGTVAAQTRDKCLGYSSSAWSNYGQCYTNDWLYDSAGIQRTMTPFANATYATYVYYVHSNGTTNANNAYNAYSMRPVIYLKSKVFITGGDGSSTNPFTLSISN